jgi:tetratricopeptide (TPR) repeat protein
MTEERIQQYLLGELGEAEIEQFELMLLEDPNLHILVEEKETDLIHSYLRKELFPFEQEYFERELLTSSRLKERIKVEEMILERIVAHSGAPENVISLKTRAAGSVSKFTSAIGVFNAGGLRKAAGVLLAIGIGFGGWMFYRQYAATSAFDGGMAALKQAAGETRFSKGRVAGFDVVNEGKRGASDARYSDTKGNIALGKFSEAQALKETAQNFRGLGLAYLANEQYDDAVKQLEDANKTDITNPEIMNDLGVAYLQQAEHFSDNEQGKRLEKLSFAVEYFARALKEKNGKYPEALFNKALALSEIPMLENASVTLNDYLKIDSSSKWADEARELLKKVDEQKKK